MPSWRAGRPMLGRTASPRSTQCCRLVDGCRVIGGSLPELVLVTGTTVRALRDTGKTFNDPHRETEVHAIQRWALSRPEADGPTNAIPSDLSPNCALIVGQRHASPVARPRSRRTSGRPGRPLVSSRQPCTRHRSRHHHRRDDLDDGAQYGHRPAELGRAGHQPGDERDRCWLRSRPTTGPPRSSRREAGLGGRSGG